MHFKVQPVMAAITENAGERVETGETAVYAVSPRYGNDAALMAVFDHPGAAKQLADILNFAAQQQRAFAPGSPV